MVGNAGGPLRTAIAILILAAIVACAFTAGKADARANINDYLSKGPNDFYPARHDIEGPTKFAIDTIGWNATSVIGNLGIGNASPAVFDLTSTRDVEYPESGFMCGDVSVQPWQPGKKNVVETATNETEEKGEGNVTENSTRSARGNQSLPGVNVSGQNLAGNIGRLIADQDADGAIGNASEPVTERIAGGEEPAGVGTTGRVSTERENQTFAAYHPIRYLNPVKDILYEHPLATSGTAYCELLGFETPAGDLVNVGMKCTGYGY